MAYSYLYFDKIALVWKQNIKNNLGLKEQKLISKRGQAKKKIEEGTMSGAPLQGLVQKNIR